ncbi:hypothetical protein AFE_1306 [Acidithiobacillus ferrooxidans ATCC 23270]|uniref:Uncharacterized protein n=1 Tax=Acidithiobacillus ferrooxidans (strain ATCC 23270 / DSM 14882 / CIP 104768 / NCIMB 8455) TaxID=243159 RepID=B7J8Y9_ACIF2|nr:hypothetical protein AFE_1306 [Acidithiobacillus ferrooxidans ATCC 23270]
MPTPETAHLRKMNQTSYFSFRKIGRIAGIISGCGYRTGFRTDEGRGRPADAKYQRQTPKSMPCSRQRKTPMQNALGLVGSGQKAQVSCGSTVTGIMGMSFRNAMHSSNLLPPYFSASLSAAKAIKRS